MEEIHYFSPSITLISSMALFMTWIPSCLTSFTIFQTKYNSSWERYWLLFSSIGFLRHLAFCSSRVWVVLFDFLSMNFEYSRAHISLSVGWTGVLQALFRPMFRWMCLKPHCFILLRKAYRRYISASKDFYLS